MIIGVTGSLATGKSTAAGYLTSFLNGSLIDADKIVHLGLRRNGPVYSDTISAFGSGLLDEKGAIDRGRLAEAVFSKRKDLERLCAIIHPFVLGRIRDKIDELKRKEKSAFIIVDGPVLIEAGFHKQCDRLVVVTSSLINQLERARSGKGLKSGQSLARIRSQLPLYEKVRHADYIIDNNGSIEELKQKCRRLAKRIKG